ncbi:2-C-methyl-D-erythritol 4-phosphate cytidylyltransferase [Brevibacterium senegalense]|uniref:2-C-methyl-D-erythritol 4-phosphate cytidylyltransferase n=1 Tax=Brevibacterium senegalense TaxID=1033736 RepID=UPI0002F6F70F|nr:2-C-methyl-D-erythritol 4-phosphate cytidylyltransferase [Brevibacterium senegalense]
MSTALLIPAAGSGTRLGAGLPKAFVPLAGRTLLARAVDGGVRSGVVDTIVIAAPAHLLREAEGIARTAAAAAVTARAPGAEGRDPATGTADTAPAPVSILVVAGGEERTVSVAAALAAVPEAETVLVHDAARCLTPIEVFHRVHAALQDGARAVVPVLPVTDTVRTQAEDGTLNGGLDRSVLRRVQTPQGFRRAVLHAAHTAHLDDPDPALTDDAGFVERIGTALTAVDGDEASLKITHPLDLRIAQLLLEDAGDLT